MTIRYYRHKSSSGVQEAPGVSETVAREMAGTKQALGSFMSKHRVWVELVLMVLMMVVGVNGVMAQTPTITTDTNGNSTIEESEKILYLIQTNQFQSFYMVPTSDGDNATTNNIPNAQMLWYFLDAGIVGTTQYYYIVSNSTGKCIYNYNGNSRGISLTVLNDLSDAEKEKCKFKLVEDNTNGTVGFYNIDVKASQTYYGLNKQNGSVNVLNPLRLTNTQYIHDYSSKWKFIQYNGTFTWPAPPFTPSTTDQTYYFKIHNIVNEDYYVSSDASSPKNVTFASTESNNMVWYFKEADSSDPWIKYYYIVNSESGQYMYYKGTATDGSNQSNAIILKEKTSENEDRFQFIIVQTARTVNDQPVECYTIIPKLLNDKYWASNCISPTSVADGNMLGIRNGRGSANNNSHWIFETSPFQCTEPVVTYDNVNDKIVISSPQGTNIYYTINGGSNTLYEDPIDNTNTGPTQTIRAVCARNADQSDASDAVTIIFNPTITLSTGSAITYDGSSHQPTISSAEFNSTDITGECAVAKYLDASGNEVSECVNAGVYTVVITDEDGGDYYVYGSTTFTINKASLTITPNDGQSKEYGDSDPVLTYTSSGLVAGDVLTGSLSRDVGENVGTYAISQGTLNNANNTNYDISFTTGKSFAITAKSLGDGTDPAPNITCDIMETSGSYSIVVKQGVRNLTLGADYTKSSESDGVKYYQVRVAGTGNYDGGFFVKLAKIQLSKRAGSVAPGGAALFVSDSGDGNFVVPDNMTAYIVTGISGNTLITEQLDNIPDHVPVLLVSTIDANGFLVQPEASATPPSGTNLLVESTGTSFGTAQIYLLYKGEFVLNAAGTVPAGKIYLPRPSSAPAPVKLYIDWDFVDGIDLEKEELRVENEEYYTLDGIKLGSKPTRKGLYITNGRKVAIK